VETTDREQDSRWGDLPRRRTRSDLVVLLVCALAIFADVVISGAVIPNIPVFAERFDADEFSLGLATSGFSIVFLAAVVPFGLAVDRTGRSDLVIALAMLSAGTAGVLFAFGGSLWTYALAQGFHGAGSAGAWIGAPPLAAHIVERRGRGGLLMSAITIALGLGLVIGPLLGSLSPVWLPFVISTAIALAVGVAALWALTGTAAEPESLTGMYGQLLRNRVILAAAALVFLLYAGISMMEILFPLYADSHGQSKAAIGLLFLFYAVFVTAGQPAMTPLLDRARRGVLETAAVLVLAAGLATLVLTADFGWWIAIFAVLGVATGVLVGASMLIIAVESPHFARGGAFALWNMAFAVGFLIGPPVGGGLVQLAPDSASSARFRLPFLAFAAFLALCAPLVWATLRPKAHILEEEMGSGEVDAHARKQRGG